MTKLASAPGENGPGVEEHWFELEWRALDGSSLMPRAQAPEKLCVLTVAKTPITMVDVSREHGNSRAPRVRPLAMAWFPLPPEA